MVWEPLESTAVGAVATGVPASLGKVTTWLRCTELTARLHEDPLSMELSELGVASTGCSVMGGNFSCDGDAVDSTDRANAFVPFDS